MDNITLSQRYHDLFGHDGLCYFSPGRINLIGEHTDYNGGFVFPGAVDKGITAMVGANGSGRVRLLALDRQDDGYYEFDLTDSNQPGIHWACYIFGVCKEIQKLGYSLSGFDAAFYGTVPFGAGMSSSAALECAFAFALNDIFLSGAIDRMQLARIGQATEHNWCGVKCGIMDQFTSVMGRKGNLVRLDCRSMEYEYFPWKPKGYSLVLVDSCVKHTLGGEYNERRESCEKAVAAMHDIWPSVQSLRDADMDMLTAVKDRIGDDDFRRSRYVIGEKDRVLAVCDALLKDDYETVGQKMYQTHDGFTNDFTASCAETDFLVSLASSCGVTGSRIMGGGFGGCTINLVHDTLMQGFLDRVLVEYEKQFGITPKIYHVVIGEGTHKIELSDNK